MKQQKRMSTLEKRKQHYIRVALELKYSDDVIDKIRVAKSVDEITSIMCKARKAQCGDDVIYGYRSYKGGSGFTDDDRHFT